MSVRRHVAGFTGAAVLWSLAMAPIAAEAQNPPQTQAKPTPAPQATPAPDIEWPVNFDRILKALETNSILNLDDQRLRFYARVVERVPKFMDYVGSFDLKNGPVPGAGMTHAEFLNMVTPKQMYGSGGITAGELLTMSLVNAAGWALIKSGIKAISAAKSEREIQAVRDRINRELAALLGKGGGG